ncbi:hypothetical protein NE865_04810 [Phthorimaea operculella]|nr:hypothetical protein NE865_04810 [Phthorimaea operculella]
MKTFVILTFLALASAKDKGGYPPHCTQVTKDTDYLSRFKFDYPTVYINPGQKEAYQLLHCTNPSGVNKAVTVVCDWAAPPQVQFTINDDYVHIIRQDPSGRFLGSAVITTYQLCNHNIPKHQLKSNITGLPHVADIV